MAQVLILKDFLAILENIAPTRLAESWDNVGLMVGDPSREVTGVLVALDPTETLLAEAVACGANTIVTHHPLIFHPLKAVRFDEPVGRLLRQAVVHDLAVVGCHTNLDQAAGGVNDVLVVALGAIDSRALVDSEDGSAGMGRYGRFPEPLKRDEFLSRLARVLRRDFVAVVGELPDEIRSVAVCGGSGSDLALAAFQAGVEVYLTGEIKLSTARWAEACGFCLIDGGHFDTENPVVAVMAAQVENVLRQKGFTLPVAVSRQQKDPFVFCQLPAF